MAKQKYAYQLATMKPLYKNQNLCRNEAFVEMNTQTN